MHKQIEPQTLFRISVLGPLVSRDKLAHGELKQLCQTIAGQTHRLPNGDVVQLSAKTIERWYYLWQHSGVEAFATKTRCDKGQTSLSQALQDAILAIKKDKPSRSINTIKTLLEQKYYSGKACLSRSAIYRFLKQHNLSSRSVTGCDRIERRRFVAVCANAIWHADVMHGPTLMLEGQSRKTYLVSMLDDASRLLTHSEFRLSEQAVDIEVVFKQALLKRGRPKKIILDNGAAYRANSMKAIAARLEVQLVYCPAYEPEGKGKIERWHRTCRDQFLSEVPLSSIVSLSQFNQLYSAWLDSVYHQHSHSALDNHQSPLQRWQADLSNMRQLGVLADNIDAIFYHHAPRTVKKDGCVSYNGQLYEVPYELVGNKVTVVIDPEKDLVVGVLQKDSSTLIPAHPLDAKANVHRQRKRPKTTVSTPQQQNYSVADEALKNYQRHYSLVADKEGE